MDCSTEVDLMQFWRKLHQLATIALIRHLPVLNVDAGVVRLAVSRGEAVEASGCRSTWGQF